MKLKILAGLSVVLIAALTSSDAQTYSVIHSFTGGSDGGTPFAGVIIHNGSLYGTTTAGGIAPGTVYQLKPSGSDWVNTTLSALSGGGFQPLARVAFGPDGRLYSTASLGGAKNAGVVFSLTPWPTVCPSLSCYWQQKLTYQFQDFPDGAAPWYGDLTFDQQGNIYGTTQLGGQNRTGSVFELSPSGNGYTEQVIYNFPHDFSEGYPRAGVIIDANGNLFGTASAFASSLTGKVYELSYVPGTGWVETDLYKFQNGSDGGDPEGGLVMDSAGNLYGATAIGGDAGGGTVYELSPSGNTWTFKVIYSLSGPGRQNSGPHASLTLDAAGNLYGTTFGDGAHHYGNIFKLTNTGNGWTYTSLHDFDVDTGANPTSNVTIDNDGTLYGTASSGGSQNCNGGCGVVWMIKP